MQRSSTANIDATRGSAGTTVEGDLDDDYKLYLAEVRADNNDENDEDHDLDVSTPSEWRAAAKSPLRGSAKRTVKGQVHVKQLQQKHQLNQHAMGGGGSYPQLSDRVRSAMWPTSPPATSSSSPQAADVLDSVDIVRAALLDGLSAIGQRPNRLLTITPSGTSWSRTAACQQLIGSTSRRDFEALTRTLDAFLQSCQDMASNVLVLELCVEMIHPSKWVLPEESFVVERWTATGVAPPPNATNHDDEDEVVGITSSSVSSGSSCDDDDDDDYNSRQRRARPQAQQQQQPLLSSYQALRRASYMSMLAAHRTLRQILEAAVHEILVLQQSLCRQWWPTTTTATSMTSPQTTPTRPPVTTAGYDKTGGTAWERGVFWHVRQIDRALAIILQPIRSLATMFAEPSGGGDPTGQLVRLLLQASGGGGGSSNRGGMAAAMGWTVTLQQLAADKYKQHNNNDHVEVSGDHTTNNVEHLCAVWVDALVWHCSKLQGCCGGVGSTAPAETTTTTSATNGISATVATSPSAAAELASTLHVILLTTIWPYVETLVWVTVGAVPSIDEEEWLRRCPKLFSAPFPQPRDPHAAEVNIADIDDDDVDSSDAARRRRKQQQESMLSSMYAASAVSMAAGCEGISRHDSWRSVRLQYQNAVKHVLSGMERHLTKPLSSSSSPASSSATLSTWIPLSFTIASGDEVCNITSAAAPAPVGAAKRGETSTTVFSLKCRFDPLQVGVLCEANTTNRRRRHREDDGDGLNTSSSLLFLDAATPVAQWAIKAILHPLALEASKRQREAVTELLTKKVTPAPAATTNSNAPGSKRCADRRRRRERWVAQVRGAPTLLDASLSLSFMNSIDVLCQHALFAGDAVGAAAFGQAFVDGVAKLPPEWWASGETSQLLVSTYYAAQLVVAGRGYDTSTGGGGVMLATLRVPPRDPNSPMIPSHVGGLLRVVQSMTISFTIPEPHAVILLPHLYYHKQDTAFSPSPTHHHKSPSHHDCYSKVLRLLTVLLLAKHVLLHRWRDLRWETGGGGGSSTSDPNNNQMALLAVGAMHLSFVVNAVVDFVTLEIRLAVVTLKAAVRRERSNVANICKAADDFIAHIELISLQQQHHPHGGGVGALGSQLVFEGIAAVVRLSLEFAWTFRGSSSSHGGGGVPMSSGGVAALVAPRVRSSATQLIAALRAVPLGSPLHERVQPLLLKLTFNGYFGAS